MLNRPSDDAQSLVARLYDRYGASLYRYAAMLLADPVAAEDAVHQVFVTLLRQLPQFEEEQHYLRRAVRNECYSHLRRTLRRGEVAESPVLLEAVAVAPPREERMALEDAIRALPPQQREVLYLHVFEGLTFREIGDAADESIHTIAARYRYGLAKLRHVLTAPADECRTKRGRF